MVSDDYLPVELQTDLFSKSTEQLKLEKKPKTKSPVQIVESKASLDSKSMKKTSFSTEDSNERMINFMFYDLNSLNKIFF